MHDTLPLLEPSDFPAIKRHQLETLQINIGLRCNQACLHCHVNSNPYRKEKMNEDTIALVIDYLQSNEISTLDITGGAPELHPQFRELVSRARSLGVNVIDRCNLTILEQPGHEDLADFLAEERVEVICSLPCYTEDNVDQQRGDGVFQYKKELLINHGITFDNLLTLSNMPIKRFGSTLVSRQEFEPYIALLKNAHRNENLEQVMCRSMVSVDWQGYLYDCDFNQMLDLAMYDDEENRMHLSDLLNTKLNGKAISVRDHCYGCTAGQGSSCAGALS
jgi:MoaA/NifB/PqqE/SkfB family radical SAM enzyme